LSFRQGAIDHHHHNHRQRHNQLRRDATRTCRLRQWHGSGRHAISVDEAFSQKVPVSNFNISRVTSVSIRRTEIHSPANVYAVDQRSTVAATHTPGQLQTRAAYYLLRCTELRRSICLTVKSIGASAVRGRTARKHHVRFWRSRVRLWPAPMTINDERFKDPLETGQVQSVRSA
jgi:hypothetical protein